MTQLIKMRKILVILLFLFPTILVFSQDLKTTEIKVVERIKVAVPDAVKLNTKASFSDTTKEDKNQEYLFFDKVFYSNFITRQLVPARIKNSSKIDVNSTSIKLLLGNYSFRSAKISYNSKYKKSFSYGLSLATDKTKYKTEEEFSVRNNNQMLYFFTKSILSKNIILSSFRYEKFVAQHDYSNTIHNDNENQFSYSEILCSINSRNFEGNRLVHKTSFFFTDLNSSTENHFSLNSEISNFNLYRPLNLVVTYNNYTNYSNRATSFERNKTDIKIIDINPSLIINKGGFDIDLGFNLGFENNGSANIIDIFPLVKVNKELVDDILNISFGIDRSDYRNTISSLSRENPYIHSFGLNSGSVNDSINYSHLLETTDLYETFFTLKNKLSHNDFLDLNMAYGRILNLHYFDLQFINDYNRFSVDYINVWQLRLNGKYQKKFNNLLALNFNVNYVNWFDEIVPHKAKLTSNLELPFTLRNKIIIVPSLNYIGKRQANQMSVNLIDPPKFDLIELDEQYLIDLNIHYSYSKKLSFNIDLNNLTNSKKELWNGYQQIGLNMSFGLNCLF